MEAFAAADARARTLTDEMCAELKAIVELLVAGDYAELARRSRFVEEDALHSWMQYILGPIRLGVPPKSHYDSAEVYPLDDPPPRWRVDLDLWDADTAGIADVHIVVWFEETEGGRSGQLKEVLP